MLAILIRREPRPYHIPNLWASNTYTSGVHRIGCRRIMWQHLPSPPPWSDHHPELPPRPLSQSGKREIWMRVVSGPSREAGAILEPPGPSALAAGGGGSSARV